MNISVQKLLAKIEAELQQAKSSTKEGSLREKIYSIKIVCELILDERSIESEMPLKQVSTIPPIINQQVFQAPPTLNQSKKMEMDNEANGDSLLDF